VTRLRSLDGEAAMSRRGCTSIVSSGQLAQNCEYKSSATIKPSPSTPIHEAEEKSPFTERWPIPQNCEEARWQVRRKAMQRRRKRERRSSGE
jgi:hypothetical protein